jgi:hypothetical protein
VAATAHGGGARPGSATGAVTALRGVGIGTTTANRRRRAAGVGDGRGGREWPPPPADLEEAERVCRALGLGPLHP